jgi:hypothetical protein
MTCVVVTSDATTSGVRRARGSSFNVYSLSKVRTDYDLPHVQAGEVPATAEGVTPEEAHEIRRKQRLENGRQRMRAIFARPEMAKMLAEAASAADATGGGEQEYVAVAVGDDDRAYRETVKTRYLARQAP